jgi:hypothetical protein
MISGSRCKNLNKNKVKIAELLGMLLTDGCVWFKNSSKCFCIGFTNKSIVLHEKFRKLMNELFGITTFNWSRSIAGIPTQICYSKKAALEILNMTNTCRTSPVNPSVRLLSCKSWNPVKFGNKWFVPITLPKFIFEDKKCTTAFLRAAFDCDGTACLCVKKDKNGWKLHREVAICSKNPFLKAYFLRLLYLLGFKNPRKTTRGIVISNKDDLELFSKVIGFTDGVEVTKGFWKGFTKKFVLNLILVSFRWTKFFDLSSFSSKQAILNSILEFSQANSFWRCPLPS